MSLRDIIMIAIETDDLEMYIRTESCRYRIPADCSCTFKSDGYLIDTNNIASMCMYNSIKILNYLDYKTNIDHIDNSNDLDSLGDLDNGMELFSRGSVNLTGKEFLSYIVFQNKIPINELLNHQNKNVRELTKFYDLYYSLIKNESTEIVKEKVNRISKSISSFIIQDNSRIVGGARELLYYYDRVDIFELNQFSYQGVFISNN